MSYHDQFSHPGTYYAIINRLINRYRECGFNASVYDWEQMVRNVSDFPSLRSLSERADYIYNNLSETGVI